MFSLPSLFSPPGLLLFHSLPFTPWPYFFLSASPGLLPPSQTKFSLSLSLDPLPPSSHFENFYPPNIFILDLLPIYYLYCPWTRYIHNAMLHQIALMTPSYTSPPTPFLWVPCSCFPMPTGHLHLTVLQHLKLNLSKCGSLFHFPNQLLLQVPWLSKWHHHLVSTQVRNLSQLDSFSQISSPF